jgi:putative transposase
MCGPDPTSGLPSGVNPLKHDLVRCVADWPHSTFHRLGAQGVYAPDWADDTSATNVPFDN